MKQSTKSSRFLKNKIARYYPRPIKVRDSRGFLEKPMLLPKLSKTRPTLKLALFQGKSAGYLALFG
jgi:hypothetical protein